MNSGTDMRYTFGHTVNAAERLRRIAEFFNPLAINFIHENLLKNYSRVVDLGCGPGYTTDMLAKATGATGIFGIDISDYFIELGKKKYPDYNFIQGDVTNLDASSKYDMMYCRFLLSHLKDIPMLFKNWITVLNPGGIICIDELEAIFTEIPVFNRYLEINNALIHSQGAELFIGKHLDNYLNGYKIQINQSDIIPVPDSIAAGWFYPNTIGIWKTEEFVQNFAGKDEREAISKELLNIHNKQVKASNITWKMKRIILTN